MKTKLNATFWKAIVVLFFFCDVSILSAQTYTMGREEYMSWDEFIANFFDEIDTETNIKEEGKWQTEALERLEELHNSPLNINTASREDLLRIPFLTEAQTDSILVYRERKKLLRSLGELQWITGIPYITRCQLSLFTFAGDTIAQKTKLSKRLYEGQHELITRLDFPLYQRAGDQQFTQEELESHPSRYYLGKKMGNTLRYRYRWKKDITYGITLQKDSGEPFAKHQNYPYDYTSLYFYYRPNSKKYSIWLGDYNVQLGEGLLISHAFFNGALQQLESYALHPKTIRPHTSSDEINYFRGVAASFDIKQYWKATIFASYRKLDGNIKNDTLISFKTDGMHRTMTEIKNRRTQGNTVAGARIAYQREKWQMGTNVYWSQYQRVVNPPLRDYNKYYLRGRSAAGASLDYAWRNTKWRVQGETAIDKSGNMATSNSVHFSCNSRNSLLFQQRSFSTRFVSPFGNTLQENSQVQNEHGFILGTYLQPFRRFFLTAYVDCFYHPRPVYRASQSSNGAEVYLQGKYAASPRLYFTLRYKLKTEKQDVTGHHGVMQYVSTHRNRLTAYYSSKRVQSNLSADIAIATRQTSETTFGWMLSTRNRLQLHKQISLHTFGALFFTDDYASRLYAYEPQLQYAASFPTFAYHGARVAGVLQWNFGKKGYAALRYGWLHYFNRNEIGTSAQLINHASKQDLSVQVGWRL